METTVVIGIIASTCIATSLIPQLIKLVREKNAENLSVSMLAVLVLGSILWIWYGVLKKDVVLIVSNSISLVLNIVTLGLTLKYK